MEFLLDKASGVGMQPHLSDITLPVFRYRLK